MKILLAPSKSRNYEIENTSEMELTAPLFEKEAEYIAARIKSMSKEQLSKVMKIKNNLLDRTYEEYGNFDDSEKHSAIYSYTGTVFKELKIDNYNIEQMEYLKSNVRILSALYGILRPFDGLKYYRLDMKMKVLDTTSYKFWERKIDCKAVSSDLNDETIINLSSSEFSKMISCPFINVDFKEEVSSGVYKTVGIYSKKARGLMANYMIMNQIESVKQIMDFNLDGYKYNNILSDDRNIVFTR